MIAPLNLPFPSPAVPRNPGDLARLMDLLKDEASLELHTAFEGVSGKRVDLAHVPGCGRHGLSRALNGCDSNPLFRVAAFFVLMKRLGLGRERALRVVEWMRELVDVIWPPEEAPSFEQAMQEETRRDTDEDRHQVDACVGIPGAAARMLDAIRARHAYDPVVMAVLRRRIAEEGQ